MRRVHFRRRLLGCGQHDRAHGSDRFSGLVRPAALKILDDALHELVGYVGQSPLERPGQEAGGGTESVRYGDEVLWSTLSAS